MKILCRIFQFFMKIGNYFVGYHTPKYISGIDTVLQLPDILKTIGCKRILLVTGKNMITRGTINHLLEKLDDTNLKYVIFNNINPNPTDTNVEDGYQLFKNFECDCIVAIGGGSPIDCAKGIAARNARPNKSIKQLQGLLKIFKKTVPFIAVPTTSGTGTETTLAAVITEEKTHHKAAIMDPNIIPHYAILDPKLTISLPPNITATTGMDALCHAVEAYINHTYNTKIENDCAKKAVKLIYENLLVVYHDGNNLEARENMQLASFYAGRAFTRGCVGYVHAIGHTLSGLYNVSHGLAMGVILPHVLKEYGSSAIYYLSELGKTCGFEGSRIEVANKFISWIESLKIEMELPNGFELIKDEDIEQIVEWAIKEANPLYPVPQIWNKKDFIRVVKKIKNA